jgi:response regulator NasT
LDEDLRIVIVHINPLRASILEDGLREAGHGDIIHIDDTSYLLNRLNTAAPDVIILDLESPSRDVLEQMCEVSRTMARPIAMFVDRSDTSMIDAAIDAGVSAYIVGDQGAGFGSGRLNDGLNPRVDATYGAAV